MMEAYGLSPLTGYIGVSMSLILTVENKPQSGHTGSMLERRTGTVSLVDHLTKYRFSHIWLFVAPW